MPVGWVILFRAVIAFFAILVLLRLMGKRQPSRSTPFFFVCYVSLGVIAAAISLNLIPNLAAGLAVLAVWAAFPIGLDYLALKSKVAHDLLQGKETILIKQGKIMEDNLFRARLTGEELLRELRSKNAFQVSEVEFAIMETTGDINVLLKSHQQPLTASDLGQKVAPQTEPQTVILDGNVLDEPLAAMGLNREWLYLQLEKMGINVVNVFIGQTDSAGELYVDLFDDALILPQPKVREMLYATLERIQAELLHYGLETANSAAKTMYTENSRTLGRILEEIKSLLLN